jgi:hypothetical protein
LVTAPIAQSDAAKQAVKPKGRAMNSGHSAVDEALLQRVYGEFLEMPGLRLTCQQAQRLWGLDKGTCLALLEFLVDSKFLCRPGHGTYTRLTDDHAHAPPRMAKAHIEDTPHQEGGRMNFGRRNPFRELDS